MAVTITEAAAKELKRVMSDQGMIAAYRTVAQPETVTATVGESAGEGSASAAGTWVSADQVEEGVEKTSGQQVEKVKVGVDEIEAKDGGQFVLKDEPGVTVSMPYLRIGIRAGGCSGFEYDFAFVPEVDTTTVHVSQQHGVQVAVDKKSGLLLDGTTIGFYEGLDKRGFTFDNPNAVKSCGCGSSFSA